LTDDPLTHFNIAQLCRLDADDAQCSVFTMPRLDFTTLG